LKPAHAPPPRLVILCAALLMAVLLSDPTLAQERDSKPLLSETLKAALAAQPPEAVQKRFSDELASGSYAYQLDLQGLNALGLDYMQRGENEKAFVVLGIAGQAAQVVASGAFPQETMAATAAAEEAQRRADAEQASASARGAPTQEPARAPLGPPRDDLERFHGLFASAEDGPQRALFLVRNCDGHLIAGPMWADVAPWVLRSAGDAEFAYDGDSFVRPFRLEITLGPDGKAMSIEHDCEFLASPLQRVGDLEASFLPDCRTPSPTPLETIGG
jgi:hypothetical protein